MSSDETGATDAGSPHGSSGPAGSSAPDAEALTAGAQAAVDGVPAGEVVDLTPPAQVARAALARAKEAARARGIRPGQPARRAPLDIPRGTPGPGGRDPQMLGATLPGLVRNQGWVQNLSVGGLMGRWREIVGDVADHCVPETFEDGILTVRADSTAYATNVRLYISSMMRQIAEVVGEDVVREVRVLGPAGPGFKRGPRSVPGRGPRDTWG